MFKVLVASQPPTWQEFEEPWEWQLMNSGMVSVFQNIEVADNPLKQRYEYRVKALFAPGQWLCLVDERETGQVRYRAGIEREE